MAIRDILALNEDQHALQDTLRGFLAGQLPSAALRAALETEAGYSPELHARLAGELGLNLGSDVNGDRHGRSLQAMPPPYSAAPAGVNRPDRYK